MSTPHELDDLAGAPIDDTDVEVLARIAKLYSELDPVPTGLVDRVTFGITLETLHAEIAELQRSSDLAGVRSSGAQAAQTVTFTSNSTTLMVTIATLSADRARIDGWVVPGGGMSVELKTPTGVLTAAADPDGRFVFAEVARGLVQFAVRPPEGSGQQPVLTPSIEI